jgi:electron transport complex protein RnfG
MNPAANVRGIRRLLPLLLVAGIGTLIILGTRAVLLDRIEDGRMRDEMHPVLEVMPLPFDNDLLRDRGLVPGLDQESPAVVYRARLAGRPVGVVVMPVVARGYNGAVELAVGISADGTLTGVRVIRHGETPGLGDQVDQRNSRWLEQLTGRSLGNTPEADWAVKPDGGAIDGISGATITPRGIIRALRGVLDRYASDPDSFYMGVTAP